MDLAELLRAVGRRWYVLILGLLLVAGSVVLTLRYVPLTYDARTSILLLPPNSSTEEDWNPFLDLGGLDLVAGVLGKSLTDSDSVQSIVPPGSTAEYTVQLDASVSGSVLEIAASGVDPESTFSTLDAVVDLATTRLDDLQASAGAPQSTHVQLMVITNNTVAQPNAGTLLRTLIVVIGGGLAATLLLTVAIDSAIRRRRPQRGKRRTKRAAEESPAGADTPAGPGPREAEEPALVGESQ